MARKVHIIGLAVGLFLSLGSPLSAAGVGCNGRCLVDNSTFLPYCSLSLFGQYLCFAGPDWCGEFACTVATSPTDPGYPSENEAIQTDSAGTADSALPRIRVEELRPRF